MADARSGQPASRHARENILVQFTYSFELIVITLAAAIVNGALGYGFSSITVPLALLFLTNRVLNPALVPIEVGLNAYVLWVNRRGLSTVRRRLLPVAIGLAPGVIIGTLIVAHVRPEWLKLGTFAMLLPLILIQAGGYRRPIRHERSFGYPFGAGVGLLYSVTTISGPPLAVFLNNQGLAKQEFRAGLGFIRLAESTFTAVAYASAGLYTRESVALMPSILPGLVVGVPLGAWLIRRIDAETFRRVCMSFDAWVVGFGLSTLLQALHLVDGPAAYLVMLAVIAIDGVLLYRFFSGRHSAPPLGISRSLAQETK
ncbi:MAG TPA: sulfite exporter TauE/SafE family protein [Vicinamibacterales bacterium]